MEKNTTKTLLTDEELKREKRKKQLAIIKASNEMLQQAKETVMNTDKIDEINRTERVREIEQAIEENKMKAQTYLQATQEEVANSVYKEASEEEKRKYKERLEKRGVTEESLNRMDMATVSTGKEETKSKRKYTVKRKKKQQEEVAQEEDIVRLPNEEELMRKSMATSEKMEEKLRKNTKQEDKLIKEITETIDNKKVKDTSKELKEQKVVDDVPLVDDTVSYDYDFSSIPEWVQYDVIPLPSKGRCYPSTSPLRSGRMPVAYLTASDENIIASPNMYRDGKIIDVILERKILDKRIDPQILCKGDRDAIVLWLRATGYTSDFPIVATHPETGKSYNINVDLSTFKPFDFNLKSDKNGEFDFVLSNNDKIKFKFLTHQQEENIKKTLMNEVVNEQITDISGFLDKINECISNLTTTISEEDIKDINGCISDIKDILYDYIKDKFFDDTTIINYVTENMYVSIVSINGNTDKEYIKLYIDNMRSKDSLEYRKFYEANKPGINMNITVNVPESDGGGSFNTFLKFSNYVFTNL